MWPLHYRQFVERNSLAGKEAEIPETADLSGGRSCIGLFDESEAADEAERFYPALIVRADGFMPIGQCLLGGGDPYFINLHDDPPGPVYRIYHESVMDRTYDPELAIVRILDSYEDLRKYVHV